MIDENLFNKITNVSYAFLIAGLLVVVFTVGTHNEGALIGTIAGYASATCATVLLAGLTYTTLVNGNRNASWSDVCSVLIPFILLFFIFGVSLTLESVYFDNISQNRISEYYGMFSYMSIMFIFIQVYIFHSATTAKTFRENGYINGLTTVKLLLLSVINMLILITLGVSLKYFSTDG